MAGGVEEEKVKDYCYGPGVIRIENGREYPTYKPFHAMVKGVPISPKEFFVCKDYKLNICLTIVGGVKTPTNELTSNISFFLNIEDMSELFVKVYSFFNEEKIISTLPDEVINHGLRRETKGQSVEYKLNFSNISISQDSITGDDFLMNQLNYLTNINDPMHTAIGKSLLLKNLEMMMSDSSFVESIFPVYTIKFDISRMHFKSYEVLQQLSIECEYPFTVINEKQEVKKIHK